MYDVALNTIEAFEKPIIGLLVIYCHAIASEEFMYFYSKEYKSHFSNSAISFLENMLNLNWTFQLI